MIDEDLKRELAAYKSALHRIAIHADAWRAVAKDSGLAFIVRKEVNKVIPDFPGGDWVKE
jgi:hypothetical protein